jgi:hypothetical protein
MRQRLGSRQALAKQWVFAGGCHSRIYCHRTVGAQAARKGYVVVGGRLDPPTTKNDVYLCFVLRVARTCSEVHGVASALVVDEPGDVLGILTA